MTDERVLAAIKSGMSDTSETPETEAAGILTAERDAALDRVREIADARANLEKAIQ